MLLPTLAPRQRMFLLPFFVHLCVLMYHASRDHRACPVFRVCRVCDVCRVISVVFIVAVVSVISVVSVLSVISAIGKFGAVRAET
jgi:hypothetical protein